jgi:lipoprotein-anchoring transpeptidase ErfK/SrfK
MCARASGPRKLHGIKAIRHVLVAQVALLLALGLATAVSLTGCTRESQQGGAPGAAPSPDEPASVKIEPAPGAHDVDPVAPVLVSAQTGTLTDVAMVNDAGMPVEGVLTPDAKVWHPVVPLGYGRSYTLTINSRGPGGKPATQPVSFSTLTPPNQTKAIFQTTSEAPLQDGATYGVGIVIVAHFDEPITDKAEAERRLIVAASPTVSGSWYWVDDQNAHWRPEHYYAAGTAVTVDAKIYGIQLAQGVFGQQDEHVKFTIGESHVSIADDHTHQVSVFRNGTLVRTMPTSMGMGGTEQVAGRTLSFWTPPGIYTVLDKGNPVVMDSSTFGLPKNSRLGYRETINYATRISIDGIYLHQLDATVWAQGNTDTSHGCLNLNGDNARWFYDFSVPGDVVEVRNSGGSPLTLAQNGDWTIPWEQWRKGTALS